MRIIIQTKGKAQKDGFALRNYQLILFQFFEFTQTLKRSPLYGGIPAVFLLPDPSNDIGICLVVQFQLDLCGIPLIILSLRLIF